MEKTIKSSTPCGHISTIDVFDNSVMKVIARFPYDVTDDLDSQCAYIRAKIFAKAYADNCDYPRTQFSLIDKFDNSVMSI